MIVHCDECNREWEVENDVVISVCPCGNIIEIDKF